MPTITHPRTQTSAATPRPTTAATSGPAVAPATAPAPTLPTDDELPGAPDDEPPVPSPSRPEFSIDSIWPKVVELASTARRLRNVVAEVTLAVLENDEAVFEADPLMLPVVHASRTDLEELLRRACGRNFKASVRPRSGAPARVPVVAGPIAAASASRRSGDTTTPGRSASSDTAPSAGSLPSHGAPDAADPQLAPDAPGHDAPPRADPTSSPLVQEAIKIFRARVIGVQPRRQDPGPR